jgi:hypothetical protein
MQRECCQTMIIVAQWSKDVQKLVGALSTPKKEKEGKLSTETDWTYRSFRLAAEATWSLQKSHSSCGVTITLLLSSIDNSHSKPELREISVLPVRAPSSRTAEPRPFSRSLRRCCTRESTKLFQWGDLKVTQLSILLTFGCK